MSYNEAKVKKIPLSVCFFCHKHDKTCNCDSTSFPCFLRRGALPDQGKTGGRAHSILGSTASTTEK